MKVVPPNSLKKSRSLKIYPLTVFLIGSLSFNHLLPEPPRITSSSAFSSQAVRVPSFSAREHSSCEPCEQSCARKCLLDLAWRLVRGRLPQRAAIGPAVIGEKTQECLVCTVRLASPTQAPPTGTAQEQAADTIPGRANCKQPADEKITWHLISSALTMGLVS